jgi:hypothetical protein
VWSRSGPLTTLRLHDSNIAGRLLVVNAAATVSLYTHPGVGVVPDSRHNRCHRAATMSMPVTLDAIANCRNRSDDSDAFHTRQRR